jgi:hypothetical protein
MSRRVGSGNEDGQCLLGAEIAAMFMMCTAHYARPSSALLVESAFYTLDNTLISYGGRSFLITPQDLPYHRLFVSDQRLLTTFKCCFWPHNNDCEVMLDTFSLLRVIASA